MFWALIAIGFTSSSILAYWWVLRRKLQPSGAPQRESQRTLEDEEHEDGVDEEEAKENEEIKEEEGKEEVSRSTMVVEDVNENDEEEEGDEEEEDEAIRAAFEQAMSQAKKLMTGSKYSRAAEKYSEAIALLSSNASLGGSKDLLALYNNRSAMFEKSEVFQKALEDILIVLTLDPLHIKARLRRARILEAQVEYISSSYKSSSFLFMVF